MVEIQKSTDKWFTKLMADVTKKIEHFVAFLFFIITIAMWFGIFIVQRFPHQAILAVVLTALAGLVAYFNRAFAVAVFIIMLIFVFIL